MDTWQHLKTSLLVRTGEGELLAVRRVPGCPIPSWPWVWLQAQHSRKDHWPLNRRVMLHPPWASTKADLCFFVIIFIFKQTSVSLIFPQWREKQQVIPHTKSCPRVALWGTGWKGKCCLGFKFTWPWCSTPALPGSLSETRFAPLDIKWGLEKAHLKYLVRCSGTVVVDNKMVTQKQQ